MADTTPKPFFPTPTGEPISTPFFPTPTGAPIPKVSTNSIIDKLSSSIKSFNPNQIVNKLAINNYQPLSTPTSTKVIDKLAPKPQLSSILNFSDPRYQNLQDVLQGPSLALTKFYIEPLWNFLSTGAEVATGKPLPKLNLPGLTKNINFIDASSAGQFYQDQLDSGVPEKDAYKNTFLRGLNDAIMIAGPLKGATKFGVKKLAPQTLINPSVKTISKETLFDYFSGRKSAKQLGITPEMGSEISTKMTKMSTQEKVQFLQGFDLVNAKPSLVGKIFGVTEQEAQQILSELYGGPVRATATGALPGTRERPGQAPAFGLSTKEVQNVGFGASGKSTNPLESYKTFLEKMHTGQVTVPEYKQAYEDFKLSIPAIQSELEQMTKTELVKKYGGMFSRSSDTKQSLVKTALDNLKMGFTASRGLTYNSMDEGGSSGALDRMIANTNEVDLANHAERVATARAERKQRMEGTVKALNDPQTYDDYQKFIEYKGKDALSPEQQVKYDELVSLEYKKKQASEILKRGVVSGINANTEMNLGEIIHSKTGGKLYKVSMANRVDKEMYQGLNTSAKKLGGHYSSFSRGFLFKDKSSAEQFMSVSKGETVTTNRPQERIAQRKNDTAEKLTQMADSLEVKGNESLNADRKTNTARRANMATGMENKAQSDIALAKTMRNLADAIESGKAVHLDGLTTKTQIEELDKILSRAHYENSRKIEGYDKQEEFRRQAPTEADVTFVEKFPSPVGMVSLKDAVQKGLKTPGSIKLAKTIQKAISKLPADTNVFPASFKGMETISELADNLNLDSYNSLRNEVASFKRIKAIGIESTPQLRTALREYIKFKETPGELNKVKLLERDMIGKKGVGIDFFPTPKAVAEKMVELADIKEGMTVLEPSAGNGNIAEAIRESGIEPDVAEISSELRSILQAKNFNIIENDFMDVTKKYDRIIMNPPFSNNMDIQHVEHAYSLLNPGGKIVSIMGEGAFFRGGTKETNFRNWLDEQGANIEVLPKNTFKDTNLLANTGANARIVEISKPDNKENVSKEVVKPKTEITKSSDLAIGDEVKIVNKQTGEVKVGIVKKLRPPQMGRMAIDGGVKEQMTPDGIIVSLDKPYLFGNISTFDKNTITRHTLTDSERKAVEKEIEILQDAQDHMMLRGKYAEKPQVSQLDRLIADNKIRIVREGNKDVYKYKNSKGNWVKASSEDKAIELATKEPTIQKPKYRPEDQEKIDFTKAQLENVRETLAEHPAKPLMKFLKEGDFQDFKNPNLAKTQKEAERIIKKNKKIMKVAESAFEDNPKLQDQFDNPDVIRDVIEDYRGKRQVEKSLVASKKNLEENVKTIAQIIRERVRPKISLIDTTGGWGRSLEIQANQALSIMQGEVFPMDISFPQIIESTMTPVKSKVNIIDTYLRTPGLVMEKIGLGKEAEMLRAGSDAYWKELPKNIKKIDNWLKTLKTKDAQVAVFQWLDGKAITLPFYEKQVAIEIKNWLKNWAERLNLPEDDKISHYITHIFSKELIEKEFDEELAKIITDKIPKGTYDPFLLERLGKKGYIEDLGLALDAYVKRATRKVHMDPALEAIRTKAGVQLEFSNLEKSQFKYVQRYIENVQMRPSDFEEGADNFIKSLIGYKLGQRPVISVLQTFRQATFRGMLGLNPTSALRNLSQGINTYAVLGEKYTALGYLNLFKRGAMEELEREGVLNSGFVQDRVVSSGRKFIQKMDKVLFAMFDTVEKINRGGAYFGAKLKYFAEHKQAENLPRETWEAYEARAIDYAKKVVRQTQFLYDAIDTPVGMSSGIAKTLFQFQTYTTKQLEFLSTINKGKNFKGNDRLKYAVPYLRYILAGLTFVYTIGRAFGMDPKELLPWFRFDVPPSLKFPVEVTKALIDAPDKYGGDRTTQEKLSDVGKSGIGLIPAGNQIKKTYEGAKAVLEGGSFNKGNNLQFQQGQSIPEKIQSVAFGKYASNEAKDFFNKAEIKKEREKPIREIYDQVQKLAKEGKVEEIKALVKDFTPEDVQTYKDIVSSEKSKRTIKAEKEMLPTVLKVQRLIKQGKIEEVKDLVKDFTEEDIRVYKLIVKKL